MIFIRYEGMLVAADDNGVPLSPREYWSEEILAGIAAEYAAGNFVVQETALEIAEPDWDNFLTPFYTPAFGNSPFDIVETAVQTASINAVTTAHKYASLSLTRHWSNCILGLTNPSVRNKLWLVSSWDFLMRLLNENSVALTKEQRLSIEALMRSYNLID